MVLYSLVISRSGFEAILMIPGTISLEITYSRSTSRQNPILKISNFPANSGKVRYPIPNEKVPSVAIAHRPAREMAILVDQLRDNPLDFVSWISPAIFP